ncbi:hypothetical protein C7E18_21855, partial [Stenotrophomonas maltophilia]
ALLEGAVEVSNGGAQHTLAPGQQLQVLPSGRFQPGPALSSNAAAEGWLQGQLRAGDSSHPRHRHHLPGGAPERRPGRSRRYWKVRWKSAMAGPSTPWHPASSCRCCPRAAS